MIKRRLLWFFFLLLLSLSSYSREVLFRSINAMIEGETQFYAKTTELEFLANYTAQELYRLKYFLTIAYSLIFMGLTAFGLRWSFTEKLPFYLCLGIYILIVLTAILSLIVALLMDAFPSFYPFLRNLVGLIHNPLLFIILSIGSFAYTKLKN